PTPFYTLSLHDALPIFADKIQVTPSIWSEAEDTALAIKTHPSFHLLEWNELTSQQIMKATIGGIKKKGRLDHLKLSPAMHKIYADRKSTRLNSSHVKIS